MKQVLYAKTLLSVYKYLERICGAIDRLVEDQARISSHFSFSSFQCSSASAVANKIIDYTERKITLINLKLLIENALINMDRQYAVLMINKYINNKSGEEIQSRFSLSERGYFRKCQKGLQSFASALSRLGYNDERLDKMLEKHCWIKEVLARNLKQAKEKSISEHYPQNSDESILSLIGNNFDKLTLFS